MRYIVRWILQLLFRTRLFGGNNLKFDAPVIIISNHVSFLDAVFLYAYLPNEVCFVVNTAIATQISFVLRWVSHITVDPLNPYSLKKLVGVIKAGRPAVLFPEGRISATGSLMKIYSGIGLIALRTGAYAQPVILRGLERSPWSRSKEKFRVEWFPQVTMYFAEREHISANAGKNFRQQKKDISDRILCTLQQVMFEARQHENEYDNIFDKLLEAGRVHGMRRTIAEDIAGTVNYRQTIVSSYALGDKLKAILSAADNVGVMLPNSIGHLITLFSLFYIGKTPAILNFTAGEQNNLDCVQAAGVKVILTSRVFIAKGNLEALEAKLASQFKLIYLEDVKLQINPVDKLGALLKYLVRQLAAKDAKLILFTSGSESKPKGVVLSHSAILANINQISSVIDYTPRDKMLNALPMFHSFGLTAGTLLPVLNGVRVFLYPTPLHYKIIPEVAYDRNITLMLGTPTFLKGYARSAHPYDFYSLRYVLAGGEKLSDEVQKLWQDKFGIRVLEGYGITETSPVLSLNTPLFNKSGTVGRFLPGIEWRIEKVPGIDEGGNLLVRGANVMDGYLLYGREFVPTPEWYDCGDVVSVDDQGFVRIRSRLKRFAKISGEMISLDVVEKIAEQFFGTDRNAAINLPDSKKGEKIVLYTTYKNASKQLLREFMSQNRQSMLALPAVVIAVEKLPLLGSGKTDYVTLKSWKIGEIENDA